MRVVSRGYAGSLAGLGQWREHGVGRVWVWRGSQGGDIMAQVTTPRPQVLRWANSSQLRRAGGGKLLWKGKMAGWEKRFGLVWTGSRDTIMQQQGRKNKQAGRQAVGDAAARLSSRLIPFGREAPPTPCLYLSPSYAFSARSSC